MNLILYIVHVFFLLSWLLQAKKETMSTLEKSKTHSLLSVTLKAHVQAQYALESSSQPLGISEYDLEKFYPDKVEGTIPGIYEIEALLSDK